MAEKSWNVHTLVICKFLTQFSSLLAKIQMNHLALLAQIHHPYKIQVTPNLHYLFGLFFLLPSTIYFPYFLCKVKENWRLYYRDDFFLLDWPIHFPHMSGVRLQSCALATKATSFSVFPTLFTENSRSKSIHRIMSHFNYISWFPIHTRFV